MPGRPRIDAFWLERVRIIKANSPRKGPGPITQELEEEARKLGRDDAPSERTVAREMERFRQLSPDNQRLYTELRWPDSFPGSLPWEAQEAALEMLAFATGYEKMRPLLKAVLWFWRITQAAPNCPIKDRYTAAWFMTACEAGDRSKDPAAVEAYLVWQPWRGGEIRDLYESADIPKFPRDISHHLIERDARFLLSRFGWEEGDEHETRQG